jgi:predicted GNAT family N-acyltransferase
MVAGAVGEIKVTEVNYNQYGDAIKAIVQDVFYDEFKYCAGRYQGDQYDEYSEHIVALDDGDVVGYIRVIKPNPQGFPCLEVARPTADLDLEKCAEFSKFVIRKEYRDQPDKVAFRLWMEALRRTGLNGLYHIVVDAFVGKEMYGYFKEIGFEECSEVYEDTRFQVEGFSVLLCLNIPELIKRFYIHRQIYESCGFDDQWIGEYVGGYENRQRERAPAAGPRSTGGLPDNIISGSSP